MRALRWILGGLLAVALLLAATVAWLVTTRAGARWVVQLASSRTGGAFTVGEVHGSLVGPLTLLDLRYAQGGDGALVRIARVEVDVAAGRLWSRTLEIEAAQVTGAEVALPASPEAPRGPPRLPLPVPGAQLPAPPLSIIVRELAVTDSRVQRGGADLLVLERANMAARWTAEAFEIDRLEVRSPQGEARLSAAMPGREIARLQAGGEFRWRIGRAIYAGKLAARPEGPRTELDLDLEEPFAASVRGVLTSEHGGRWELALAAPSFDPRGKLVGAESRLQVLAADLQAAGSAESLGISGRVAINGDTIHVEDGRFAVAEESIRIERLAVRVNEEAGAITAAGTVRLDDEGPNADLVLNWEEFTVPPAWTGRPLLTRGELELEGGLQAYTASGEIAVGPPGRLSELDLAIAGTPEEVRVECMRIRQPVGSLTAEGSVQLEPEIAWDLRAASDAFDPGEFAPAWPGRLDGRITTRGRLAEGGPQVELTISGLAGTLRDRPVAGTADLAFSTEESLRGELHLESGDTQVRVTTTGGPTPSARLRLAVPAIESWLAGVTGDLHADFLVRGRWPDVAINGRARGGRFEADGLSAGAFELVADVRDPRAPAGTLHVRLAQVFAAGVGFDDVQLEAAGDVQAHEVKLTASGAQVSAEVKIGGGVEAGRWSGSLEHLRLGWRDKIELALRETVRIDAGRDGSFELARACLAGNGTRLCVEGGRTAAGDLRAVFAVDDLPLELAEQVFPGALPARLEGLVSGGGELNRPADGSWRATAQLNSGSAHAILPRRENAPEGAPERLLVYENLRVEGTLEGGDAHASVAAGLIANGRLAAQLTVTGLDGPTRTVDAQVEAKLPTLEPVATLLPQVPGLGGRVDANARISGPWHEPEVTGHVEASGLRGDLPRLGLRLGNGSLRVEPAGGRSLKLSGRIGSGQGRVVLEGTWEPAGAAQLTIKGTDFLAADLPSARVVVVPDLRLTLGDAEARLGGSVRVTEAAVNLQQLPQGQGRVRGHSPDVVVVDRAAPAEERGKLPLTAEVTVEIGDNVRVTGFGLDAKLGGRLTVMEAPGVPTSAAGEVTVQGTYQGYGQDLRITRGRVLYASTPIADPQLDIAAVREIDNITAGVRISGTARNPEVNVFSEPEMGQAEALSYVVTGKPLSGVGSQRETDLLDSAARSLGTAAGSLVAERIGRKLGIDEIGIDESDMIEGGVFTIGQNLSPRLYVGYGVGLFESGELVTLRYELSESLDLRAVRGPDETRAGIEYRVER